ncbi:hypothetical protein [Cellulomonas sp. P5_C5]
MVVSIDPDGVLAVSAATLLVSQDLSERGRTLQAEIDAVDHLVGYRPMFTGRVNATVGDLAELAGWSRQLVITYIDDERPLQQLKTLGYWLPDFSKLGWDGDMIAGQNVDKIARSDEFGSFVLGTAGGLLERYRRYSFLLPTEGVPGPSLAVRAPDVVFRGMPFVQGAPGQLLLPQFSSVDPDVRRIYDAADSSHTLVDRHALTAEPTLGRPPAWARVGGKTLGVAGIGLTVYDSYMSQWEQDATYHPEWDTGERVASAGYNAVAEGGGAIAGGIYGAQLGAALGSFIPIPIVGTVGGALIGGAIGAFVGSKAGKVAGDALLEVGELGVDKAKDVWNSLFG